VKIEHAPNASKKEYQIFFIDYGNHDLVELEHLRPLSKELSDLPPQAQLCTLSCLRAPHRPEYIEASTAFFTDLAFGRELTAKIDYYDRILHHVTLVDPVPVIAAVGSSLSSSSSEDISSPLSINSQMILSGWCRVYAKNPQPLQALAVDLKKDEDETKLNHLGIFEYGSYASDDEDSNL